MTGASDDLISRVCGKWKSWKNCARSTTKRFIPRTCGKWKRQSFHGEGRARVSSRAYAGNGKKNYRCIYPAYCTGIFRKKRKTLISVLFAQNRDFWRTNHRKIRFFFLPIPVHSPNICDNRVIERKTKNRKARKEKFLSKDAVKPMAKARGSPAFFGRI